MRALTELESCLAGHLPELQRTQHVKKSQSEILDVGESRELEDVWQEATQAVTERYGKFHSVIFFFFFFTGSPSSWLRFVCAYRLEQCHVLMELLKKFQSTRGELSATLHQAESTISEQASYMGKANICRLHTKVYHS